MTPFQQGILHTLLLVVAVLAVALLQAFGELSATALSAIIGIAGIGNVAVAALPSNTPAPTPAPKVVTPNA